MCFYIDKNNPKQLIAESDITCFKIGYASREGFRSLYLRFIYKKKGVYKTTRLVHKKGSSFLYIEQGFHSHIGIQDAFKYIQSTDIKRRIGLFEIPKGSKYYISEETNEYVSNSIKFIRVI